MYWKDDHPRAMEQFVEWQYNQVRFRLPECWIQPIRKQDFLSTFSSQTFDKIEVKKEITKEVKETETPNLSEITDIEIFYKSIEDKIYANIESNVDKTLIKDNAFVNIRVTILKDGRYEQLTFMDGSKDNFELFRSSITQVFPLKINDSLKENFPRYFRMKIEIK